MQEELQKKDNMINSLTNEMKKRDMEYSMKSNEFNTKIEDKNTTLQLLLDKYEKVAKELGDTVRVIFYLQ